VATIGTDIRELSRSAECTDPIGTHPITPHKLRHFVLTWLKKQGIDDALIQPYSGHASRQSLEMYSRLAIADAQTAYADARGRFPRVSRLAR